MSKKNRNKYKLFAPTVEMPMPSLNIMQRHKDAHQLANDAYNVLSRKAVTDQQRYEFVSEATDICFFVFARILFDHYGKLKNKEERLRTLYDLFIKYYSDIGDQLTKSKPVDERNAFMRKQIAESLGFDMMRKYLE